MKSMRCSPLLLVVTVVALSAPVLADPAPLSSRDEDLLARLVLAEAAGEGEVGMAAVARSVLNRSALVRDGLSAGTYNARSGSLSSVINARGQFEPVSSGSINRRRSAADLAAAKRAIALARDTEAFRARLRARGLSNKAIDRILSATGFRALSAYNDSSQNYARQTLGNHVFNGDKFSVRRDVIGSFEARYGDGDAPPPPVAAADEGDPTGALATSAEADASGRGLAGALSDAFEAGAAEVNAGAASVGDGATAIDGPTPSSSGHASSPTTSPRPRPRPAANGPLAAAVAEKPLEFGARGPAVEELQRMLGVEETGLLGPTTRGVLEDWQERNGLPATGAVDRPTLDALSEVAAPLADARRSESNAYSGGRNLGPVDVVTIDGKEVAVPCAEAFLRMRAAARKDGVQLRVVSGFRTYAHQKRLYDAYRAGRGNLAAPPGYSNHQSGRALDLNTSDPGVYSWLTRNAATYGFVRTVPSEKWHWELR